MKKLLLRNFNLALLLFLVFLVSACVGVQNPGEMTPKQKLTMAYGTYNSQYALYMSDTGYILNDVGKWEKVSDPVLSEDKKRILRKKKELLSKMHPLIRIYDSMVNGKILFNADTEAGLFELIDEIALLVPD